MIIQRLCQWKRAWAMKRSRRFVIRGCLNISEPPRPPPQTIYCDQQAWQVGADEKSCSRQCHLTSVSPSAQLKLLSSLSFLVRCQSVFRPFGGETTATQKISLAKRLQDLELQERIPGGEHVSLSTGGSALITLEVLELPQHLLGSSTNTSTSLRMNSYHSSVPLTSDQMPSCGQTLNSSKTFTTK